MSSYFFLQAKQNSTNENLIASLFSFATSNKSQLFLLDKPLGDQKYDYGSPKSLILLAPKHKLTFINYGETEGNFEDFVEDVIEDIGSIADKYQYKEIIGRPRKWRDQLVAYENSIENINDINAYFESIKIDDSESIKKIDLIISLFTGSINDVDRVKASIPETLLDKVKQKIQLFDGDQTRFIYEKSEKKTVRIQGLSGTGKTELLLHKLKELYTSTKESKIFFTCHNKILADNLKKRIPAFFNFMKVEQQIEWNERLWCTNAWGSGSYKHSGAYRFITSFYEVPFRRFTYTQSFAQVCTLALEEIKAKYNGLTFEFALDYMLIDESQDFGQEFFDLCEFVTRRNIFIAGDIFQSIFDVEISSSIDPDFLLGKCYRTDPKTLMFAHALGMGLFENPKLRWLDEKEWRDCGYDFEKHGSKIHLWRQPLRRFEDIEKDYQSIKIVDTEDNIPEKISLVLKEIRKENPTVTANDIGIIFLDSRKSIYPLADQLEIRIQYETQWKVNKAYESKEKIDNTVLISNRNNVKGLEYPFVICISKNISRNPSYRNSLYTMISRSFIRTYLLIPCNEDAGYSTNIQEGLNEIINNNKMIIDEPSESEKKAIKTTFEYEYKKMSHFELMSKILKANRINRKYLDLFLTLSQDMNMVESDEDTLTSFVLDNLKYINT